jgi:hypothetical protein
MFAHASTASAVAFRPIATARLAGTGRSQTTKTRSRVVSNVASSGAPSGASSPTAAEMYPALYDPKQRDAKYGGNIAQYLVDCHDTPGVTFNFCGGMMFGLVLSPALRAHLGEVASAGAGDPRQPKLYDASVARMSMKPDGYDKDASADDATVFHGREVRKVSAPPHGSTSSMFIHLSLANGDDVEGWSAEEVDEYSGWMSDRGRRWRDGGVYAAEGKRGLVPRQIRPRGVWAAPQVLPPQGRRRWVLAVRGGWMRGRGAVQAEARVRLWRAGREEPFQHLRMREAGACRRREKM